MDRLSSLAIYIYIHKFTANAMAHKMVPTVVVAVHM